MDPILAAILAMTAKVTGSGIKGGGEYLLGKSSSSSGGGGGSDNGLINKVIQGNKAIKAAGDTSAAGVGENAGVAATGSGAAGSAGASGAAGSAAAGAGAGAGAAGASAAGGAALAASDEKLKRVCGDNADLINLFSKIGSYEFNYTDKARSLYPNGKNHVDNKRHVGVMAQELEKNPATNAVINTDKNGYKTVDTVQLTLTNTAVLADVCRRLEALEQSVEQRI